MSFGRNTTCQRNPLRVTRNNTGTDVNITRLARAWCKVNNTLPCLLLLNPTGRILPTHLSDVLPQHSHYLWCYLHSFIRQRPDIQRYVSPF